MLLIGPLLITSFILGSVDTVRVLITLLPTVLPWSATLVMDGDILPHIVLHVLLALVVVTPGFDLLGTCLHLLLLLPLLILPL